MEADGKRGEKRWKIDEQKGGGGLKKKRLHRWKERSG